MKIVLLSGGSGKRLWPLYGESRSRQFLKVLHNEENQSESMLMRVYRQIKKAFSDTPVYITAIDAQRDAIIRQLGEECGKYFITEPSRRGTYPAVLLSCAHIIESIDNEDEMIMFLPVDSYVEQDYFEAVRSLCSTVAKTKAFIGLLSIYPTYPSEKYGYILGESSDQGWGRVTAYTEKPDKNKAEEIIKSGGRWNGGVFCLPVSFAKKLIEDEIGSVSSKKILKTYNELPAISFDVKVVENADNIVQVPYDGEWKDLGTWNTLTEMMKEPDGGLVLRGEGCENTHVINELGIPVVALGLRDMVVVASADGILVSDKHKSSYMQPYVEQYSQRPMYEKRQWGEYRVLDLSKCSNGIDSSLTKRMCVEKGKTLSYQSHRLRDEMWTITDGEGYFVLDGEVKKVTRGDALYIRKGQWHAMTTVKGVEFIEVQLGTELVEEDIERKPFDWNKALGFDL